MSTETKRRTKRRYAHELYPHGEEFEVRELTVEVPYLYSRAIGFDVWGTSWFDHSLGLSAARSVEKVNASQIALMADAMLQGLTGQEAWEWADSRMDADSAFIYERADHYGVDASKIKPYPCGPEPDHHDHHSEPDARGWRTVTRVASKESECEECTEPTK